MKIKKQLPSPCKNPATYYLWLGGSCDYNHEARYGGGAYMLEKDGNVLTTYAVADTHTTEFRMILTVMIQAMETLPEGSDLCFLTNVQYLQNYDQPPTEKSANADLILRCIEAKRRHTSVTLRLIPYHKYEQLPKTHQLAHEAMLNLRQPKTENSNF